MGWNLRSLPQFFLELEIGPGPRSGISSSSSSEVKRVKFHPRGIKPTLLPSPKERFKLVDGVNRFAGSRIYWDNMQNV